MSEAAPGITMTKIPNDVLAISGSTASSLSKDDSSSVYTLGGGYDFTKNWAIEGWLFQQRKIQLPAHEHGGRHRHSRRSVRGSAWYVSGIGKLPLQDQFYLYGKLGVAATTTKTNIDTTGAVTLPAGTSANRKKSEGNFLWGFGAGYDFNSTVGVRIDYTRVLDVGDSNTGEGDVNTLMAGVRFRF